MTFLFEGPTYCPKYAVICITSISGLPNLNSEKSDFGSRSEEGGSSRTKVHSARAKYPESRKSNGVGGGGVIAEKSLLGARGIPRVSKVQWGRGGG